MFDVHRAQGAKYISLTGFPECASWVRHKGLKFQTLVGLRAQDRVKPWWDAAQHWNKLLKEQSLPGIDWARGVLTGFVVEAWASSQRQKQGEEFCWKTVNKNKGTRLIGISHG